MAPQPSRDPFPVVFVEYFVGERDVFALSWQVRTDGGDAIVGVRSPRVWQVMSAERLRGYARPADFRSEYSRDAALGEQLLGRALGDAVQGSANRDGGSFGVIIAPDGPLWLVRWEQVQLRPRGVTGVAARGAGDVTQISRLRDLLQPRDLGGDRQAWRRAGIWCVPALAGEWQGAPNAIDKLELGVLVAGEKANVASFRKRGSVMIAPIVDPTVALDFGWVQFARSVRPEELGYLFWDRRWGAAGWEATPYTSFSLIQMP